MCFSAGASFSVAGILSIIGLLSIKQVRDKRLYPLSLIPLLFAAQQFNEGILWLALGNCISSAFISPAAYIFLSFALILWPLYIPLLTVINEKHTLRKRLLYIPLCIGILFAAGAAFYLVYYGINAQILSCHILYNIKDVTFSNYLLIPYLIATIAPLFISSMQKMWILGIALLIAFAVSFVAYNVFLASIWCFFAALISLLLSWIVIPANQKS